MAESSMDDLAVQLDGLLVAPPATKQTLHAPLCAPNGSDIAITTSTKVQKPFLKWVGGKTQLLPTILPLIPHEINNYYEPFVGGGSVLMAVLSLQQAGDINIKGDIVCSDFNSQLINVYKCMQSHPQELHDIFTRYLAQYHVCDICAAGVASSEEEPPNRHPNRHPSTKTEAMQSKESYYYWTRKQYNDLVKKDDAKDYLEMAGHLLFLNKTCFRGMYREGPNGFNIPYGHYKKTPQALSLAEFHTISASIQPVQFTSGDFSTTLDAAVQSQDKQDFIYLDPPYTPIKAASFVNYTKSGFDENQHRTLFDYMNQLSSHSTILMSNSNADMVLNAFQSNPLLTTTYIDARRAINAKNPGKKVKEVLVGNVGIVS